MPLTTDCIRKHDVKRLDLVADSIEFSIDVAWLNDIASIKVPEIKLDTGPKADLQRDLIDSRRRLATWNSTVICRRMVMPWCVHVCPRMSAQRYTFNRPSLAVQQIFLLQPSESLAERFEGRFVIDIVDLGLMVGRTGRTVLEGDGKI